jgi:hypothetical protein
MEPLEQPEDLFVILRFNADPVILNRKVPKRSLPKGIYVDPGGF